MTRRDWRNYINESASCRNHHNARAIDCRRKTRTANAIVKVRNSIINTIRRASPCLDIRPAIGLVVLAAASSGAAATELLPVRTVGSAVVYIDPATIERTPDRSKVWSLWNHASDQLNVYEEPYRSARFLNDYDCRTRTVRLIEIREYREPLGQGRPLRVYGGEGLNERGVPRGSVGDEIFRRVCSPSEEPDGDSPQ